jgi:hypothetical protein
MIQTILVNTNMFVGDRILYVLIFEGSMGRFIHFIKGNLKSTKNVLHLLLS